MSGKHLPIGAFARLCRLSVKQLRHYDSLGLLPAAWVDPATGYRYYRPDQARDAVTVGLLRSMGVPLSSIGEVLSGHRDALGRFRDELEAELRRKRSALATLERVLQDGLPSADVAIVDEPDRRVTMVRDVAHDPTDIGPVTSGCVQRLLEGVTGPPQLIGLFPLDLTDPILIQVALVTPDGGEVLPGGRFARAVHIGLYNQINLTAHALLSWCAERGHVPRGPVREVYVEYEKLTYLDIPLEDLA